MFKRNLVILSLAALLVTGFAFTASRPAAADPDDTVFQCYSLYVPPYILPLGYQLTFRFYNTNGFALSVTVSTGGINQSFMLPNDGFVDELLNGSLVFTGTIAGGPVNTADNCTGGGVKDGRINDGPSDVAASVALYCSAAGDGGIDAYAIDGSSSEGTLAFRTTGDEDSAALDQAASDGSSVQIASANGITLWANPGGDLSVTAPDLNGEGKTYRFDFAGDTCG